MDTERDQSTRLRGPAVDCNRHDERPGTEPGPRPFACAHSHGVRQHNLSDRCLVLRAEGSSYTINDVMLATLRRHPIPIQAFFRHSLILTYAFPENILQPFLPPGLTLDSYDGNSFLAIALVQTEQLRPVGLPAAVGCNFFLSGYRIFSRYRRNDGKVLRGLLILRSDADSSLMVWGGNLLTHYRYSKCVVNSQRTPETLEIVITTPRAEADLSVRAFVEKAADAPPTGSPFADLKIARRYAGPLPFTFDYEPESRQMVIVEGVRQNWNPIAVRVEVDRCAYLSKPPFSSVPLCLANAFFIENIPYSWRRGVVAPLRKENV